MDEVPGWAGRTMVFLRVGAQLVAVNALIALGTAGGVLLGLMPALAAGTGLLAHLVGGDPSDHLWREFWAAYRAGWRRLNVLGIPFWLVGGFVAVDLAVLRAGEAAAGRSPAAGALTAAVVVLVAALVLALAYLFPVARRYPEPAVRTWRFVLVAAVTAPVTALAVLVPVLAWAVLVLMWPVLGVLAGLSVPLALAGWVVDQRLDAIDARPGSSASATGPVALDSRTTIS